MALSPEERQKFDEMHNTVNQLSQILLGNPGEKNGLLTDVREIKNGQAKLWRYFWVMIGVMLGYGIATGVLSFSTLSALRGF